MPKSIPWRDIAFALFIFAVAFLIRSYDLGRLPLNHDEASAARHLLGWPGLFKEFCGVPKFALSFFSEPLASLLTREASGPKTYVPEAFVFFIRSGHVLFGALTVSSLFLFARDMYGRLTAMIASVLLCFLPWHIAQSRLAGLVTQVPLLGCLMFWGLFRARQEKKTLPAMAWFLLACFFLKKSTSGYNSAVLFMPMFVISLLWLSEGIERHAQARVFGITLLIAGICFFWLFQQRGIFLHGFYRHYHRNIFEGNLFLNLWENFRTNFQASFRGLFFDLNGSSMFTARALRGPLLIHPAASFLFLGALIDSVRRRGPADKVILVWLGLGFAGVLAGVSFFEARYAFIFLPPLVILIGKGIATLFDMMPRSGSLKRYFLLLIAAVFLLGLVTAGLVGWGRYFYEAPFDFNENRNNSYGSREAAFFLSRIPGIDKSTVFMDHRMTADVYLYLYLRGQGLSRSFDDFKRSVFCRQYPDRAYYLLWAPESHANGSGLEWAPSGMFDGVFKKKYPGKVPVKTVYYPNGLPALKIYRTDVDAP